TSGVRPGRSGGVRVARLRTRPREHGQTMAEYAVILGVITPLIVLTLGLISDAIAQRIELVAGFITGGGS
ncbi:MAG: Flp family type IVb pilin, partial [Gaiellaceae bacterium]